MIDTGSDSEVSISPAVAERTRFKPQTDIASVGAGGVVVQPLGRLTDFTLGAYRVSMPMRRSSAQTGGERKRCGL